MPRLKIILPNNNILRFTFLDYASIGSHPENSIVLRMTADISDFHAAINKSGNNNYFLFNFSGNDRMKVNGKSMARNIHKLAPGDTFQTGEVLFEFGQTEYDTHRTFSKLRPEDVLNERSVALSVKSEIGLNHNTLTCNDPLEIYYLEGTIKKVARSCKPVLIYGEYGTRKSRVAHAIYHKYRSHGHFFPMNFEVPYEYMEDNLYGNEKGIRAPLPYFSIRNKAGYMERAREGTLLLENFDALQPCQVPKLVEALKTRKITRLGGSKPIDIKNTRIILTTSKNFDELEDQKKLYEYFESCLPHRIIKTIPLRERREGLPALVYFFLTKFSLEMRAPLLKISPEVFPLLKEYYWPGNDRNLIDFIERIVALKEDDCFTADDLSRWLPAIPIDRLKDHKKSQNL